MKTKVQIKDSTFPTASEITVGSYWRDKTNGVIYIICCVMSSDIEMFALINVLTGHTYHGLLNIIDDVFYVDRNDFEFININEVGAFLSHAKGFNH